jgi:hypothetical protein
VTVSAVAPSFLRDRKVPSENWQNALMSVAI